MIKTPTIMAAVAAIAVGGAMTLSTALVSAPAAAQSVTTIWVNASEAAKAGRYSLQRGKIDEAIGYLERGLKETTSNRTRVSALSDLCIAYRLKGDAEAALKACDAALEINPRSWRAYNNRGNVHLDGQDYLSALGDYESALELKPKSKIVKKNIETVRTLVTSTE